MASLRGAGQCAGVHVEAEALIGVAVFQPQPGLHRARPYDLRHSFASLLLHEGRSVIYVARQLGHDARYTLGTYGHVIDELDGQPQLGAEDAILAARVSGLRAAVTS